jgi:hypothetical protein
MFVLKILQGGGLARPFFSRSPVISRVDGFKHRSIGLVSIVEIKCAIFQ